MQIILAELFVMCPVQAIKIRRGGAYRDYFRKAEDYYITNYGGYRGFNGVEKEIFLDLEKDLPAELDRQFDVVFNHTTLEHIFSVEKAFENICKMSKQAVIIVVPFMQEVHISESFDDYWRFTPYAIEKMFEHNDFTLVVCEHNNEFDTAVYLFCVAIRNCELNKYKAFCPVTLNNDEPVGRWLGNDKKLFKFIRR